MKLLILLLLISINGFGQQFPKYDSTSRLGSSIWFYKNGKVVAQGIVDDWGRITKPDNSKTDFPHGSNQKDTSFELPDAARKVFEEPQPKTDTVKGWLVCWEAVVMPFDGWLNVFQKIKRGIAIYPRGDRRRELKIQTDDGYFDLTKRHEFIPDSEIDFTDSRHNSDWALPIKPYHKR